MSSHTLNESYWTKDVIFIVFVIYKQMVYPHLVGWMNQVLYIPNWLGEWMYV